MEEIADAGIDRDICVSTIVDVVVGGFEPERVLCAMRYVKYVYGTNFAVFMSRASVSESIYHQVVRKLLNPDIFAVEDIGMATKIADELANTKINQKIFHEPVDTTGSSVNDKLPVLTNPYMFGAVYNSSRRAGGLTPVQKRTKNGRR